MRLHPLANVALLVSLIIMTYAATGAVLALHAQSEVNKGQQRTVLCFDAQDRVTRGDDWKECRTVAVRELNR